MELLADRVAEALLPDAEVFHHAQGDELDDTPSDATRTSHTDGGGRLIRVAIPALLKRAGMEMKFIIPGAEEGSTPDASLVRLLIRAHALARRLAMSPGSNLEDIGALDGIGAPYAARLLRLNYLAPDIVIAILNGRQPVGLTARKLMADTRLPLERSEQRTALGFV